MTSSRTRDRRAGLVFCLFALVLLTGCPEGDRVVGEPETSGTEPADRTPAVEVRRILDDPAAFAGRDVTVHGQALPGLAFEFINEQPYQLDDGSGVIWVVTSGTLPAEGVEVTVRGTVAVPYQIKGRSYDVVIREQGQSP